MIQLSFRETRGRTATFKTGTSHLKKVSDIFFFRNVDADVAGGDEKDEDVVDDEDEDVVDGESSL